jgi:hypothetical protein
MNTMFNDGKPNITFILSEPANDVLRYRMYDKLGKLHEELRAYKLDANSSAMFANDVYGYQLVVFLNGDIENSDIKIIIECITRVVLCKQDVNDDECTTVVYGYGVFKAILGNVPGVL